MFSYPLELTYGKLSLVTRMQASDAEGRRLAYLEKKILDAQEDFTVYADESQARPLFHVHEEDFVGVDATYELGGPDGVPIVRVKNLGMKSLWRSTYEILDSGGEKMGAIYTEKPWVTFANGLVSAPFDWLPIPFFDNISDSLDGLVFAPTYVVNLRDRPVMRLKKFRSLLKGKFGLQRLGDFSRDEEELLFFSVIATVLIERSNS